MRLRHGLRAFADAVATQCSRRSQLQRAQGVLQLDQRLLRRMLTAWCDLGRRAEAGRLREQQQRVTLQHRFVQWRRCAQRSSLLARARKVEEAELLRRAVGKLNAHRLRRSRERRQTAYLQDRSRFWLQRSVFRAWSSLRSGRARERGSVLRAWADAAMQKRRERVADEANAARLLRSAWHPMLRRVLTQRSDGALAVQLLKHHRRRRIAHTLARWNDACDEARRARSLRGAADEFRVQWLRRHRQAAAVRSWAAEARSLRQQRNLLGRVDAAAAGHLMSKSLLSWAHLARQRVATREAGLRLEGARAQSTARSVFGAWLAASRRARALERVDARISEGAVGDALRQHWSAWRLLAWKRVQAREGQVRLALLRMKGCIATWRDHTVALVSRREDRRRAAQHALVSTQTAFVRTLMRFTRRRT
jgi:hypothetical protein